MPHLELASQLARKGADNNGYRGAKAQKKADEGRWNRSAPRTIGVLLDLFLISNRDGICDGFMLWNRHERVKQAKWSKAHHGGGY